MKMQIKILKHNNPTIINASWYDQNDQNDDDQHLGTRDHVKVFVYLMDAESKLIGSKER